MKNGIFLLTFFVNAICFYSAVANITLHNRLYQEILNNESTSKNIIFSPFSIQLCIALAHFGAVGDTANEISNVIGYSSNFNHDSISRFLDQLNGQNVLQVANKAYVKDGLQLNPQYETSIKKSLKSDVESIDFGQSEPTAKKINDWIESQTNHKIKDMIKPGMLTPTTSLMLINAVYFKAPWDKELDDIGTGTFTNYDQSVSTVPMIGLSQYWVPLFHDNTLEANIIKLRYRDTNISMYLVVPDTTNGLSKVEQNLERLNFNEINSHMQETFIKFEMPKFEFKTELQLSKPLKQMGMTTAFSTKADFSNIFNSKGLGISEVIHSAYIKVDEKGTEAGAATAIILLGASLATPQVTIKVDRPFLFAIVSEDYDVPLFMGVVKDLK